MTHPDEDHTDPSSCFATGFCEITIVMASDSGDNDVTDHHTKSSNHEEYASTPGIDPDNGWEGEDNINHSQYTGRKQRSRRGVEP